MINYEFRHDFMANAVDEVTSMTNSGWLFVEPAHRLITYSWMKEYWTPQERNDWFNMYAMRDV